MPRVINVRETGGKTPRGAVYVGRPSKWGNPFSHRANTLARFRVETRDDAVDAFREFILSSSGLYLRLNLDELRGKDLACWCAPLCCHADVLLELANAQ